MHIMTTQTMSGEKVYLGYDSYIRKKFSSPPMNRFNSCLSRNVTWCDLGNRPFLLPCLFFWNNIIPRFSRPELCQHLRKTLAIFLGVGIGRSMEHIKWMLFVVIVVDLSYYYMYIYCCCCF